MAKGGKPGKRIRHDARSWVLKALQSSEKATGMLTSEIKSKVARLRGAKIPDYSIYQALRTLVKRKAVSVQRKGRELVFALSGGEKSARASASAARPTVPAGAMASPSPTLDLPHKIAPGEVSILHVSETHVETATNEHGKIVLERHRRPTH